MITSFEELSPERQLYATTGFARGSKIEMNLSCTGIPRMDLLSNSDPFCIVYSRPAENLEKWEKLGKTETIHDTHDCKWARKFYINTTVSLASEFRFELYDRDSERDNVKDHDFIGYVEGKTLLNMFNDDMSHSKLEISRHGKANKLGFLFVTLDWIEKPLINYNVTFEVQLWCSVRAKMYFQIMRKTFQESQYVVVYRSKLLDKDDAKFGPATLRLNQLSAGSSSRLFRIEVFQFQPMGRSKLLGYVKTNVDQLTQAKKTELEWVASDSVMANANAVASAQHNSPRSGKTFGITINE